MRARLLQLFDRLRASYWFIPSLMSGLAVLLAVLTSWLDQQVGEAWIEAIDWIEPNRPGGARDVLSAVASSMITVAGVVFSITVAAVVYASGQHGPRLLTNFMRDRGNQVTLGTFIATFLYCLLVLRTVRDPEAGATEGGFVPHIGLFVALGLAVCSIAVLVYFIHHVPQSIHVSRVVADIGRQLRRMTARRFSTELGRAARGDAPEPDFEEGARPLEALEPGYLQAVDDDALLRLARRYDLVLRLHVRPGDFVRPGLVLADVYPAERADERVLRRLHRAFAWGDRRTPMQDLLFLVDELVEIAARALSSGINDPMTAVTCLDWLATGAAALAGRPDPPSERHDAEGSLRVLTRPVTFAEYAEAAFAQLRAYVATDRIAALHMMDTLGALAEPALPASARSVLRGQAQALMEAAEVLLQEPRSLEALRRRHQATMARLRDGKDG